MIGVLEAIQHQERSEARIKEELLVLLMSKQVKFLSEIPQDWEHCTHVDMQPDADFMEPERLRAVLNTLVGYLAHSGRHPVDVCAVKNSEVYSIVVRT